MDKTTKEEFAKVHKDIGKLANTVEKGFAAVTEDLASFRNDFTEQTKDFTGRFISIDGQLVNIEQEVRSIRRELETLRDKVGNIEGYGKEIDHGLERIARIELFAALPIHACEITSTALQWALIRCPLKRRRRFFKTTARHLRTIWRNSEAIPTGLSQNTSSRHRELGFITPVRAGRV